MTARTFNAIILLTGTNVNNGKRIYLVDDDASVRKALKRYLMSLGLQVDIFVSAEDFLERLPSRTSGCLILDVRMPGLSGLELQDRLRTSGYNFSVIFITAYANPQDRERALNAGAVAYLTKPVKDDALLEALHQAGSSL